MRCVSAVQLLCFGVIVCLLSGVPQVVTSTEIVRGNSISAAPISQSSELSLVARSLSPGRYRDAGDFLEHGYGSRLPSTLSPRSLAEDLMVSGLRFIFSQFDVIASSALAYRYTTEFYRNLTAILTVERRRSPPPQKLVVAYGALKLTAAYVHGRGLSEEVLARILLSFAEYVLDMSAMILFGAFRAVVWLVGDIRVIIGMDIAGIGD